MASPSTVDVFIASLNQQPAAHAGPLGRVTSLVNGIATHYLGGTLTANGPTPAKLKIETRAGFTSTPTVLRDIATGAIGSGSWLNPELLAAIDSQLVSICNAVPRVAAGQAWSDYTDTRVVSNILSQTVDHTTDRVLQAPSHALIGTVKASVWTEVAYDASGNPVGTAYIGFKNADTWVRTPTVLFGPGLANKPVLAKICTDGTVFWVIVNDDAGSHIVVKVFDTHGVQLASTTIVKNSTTSPGDFDITYLTSGPVTYYIDPTGAQYAGGGFWTLPRAGFLPSAAGGTMTISGDPASVLNQTYTIGPSPSHGSCTTTQTPVVTSTYSVPGSGSNTYLGIGTWHLASSTLNIPVGATIVVSSSSDPTLNGTYTVTAWNNSTKNATMTPVVSGGGRAIGASASIIVTYPASLPYSLGASDVISVSYTVPGRVVLIQPYDPVTPLIGVDFSTLTFNGASTITETRIHDLTAKCTGALSWLTNDLDHLGYFACANATESSAIYGYQATGAGQCHEYATGQSVGDIRFLGSLIGWPQVGIATNKPTLIVGIGYLSDGTALAGALYDPALRTVTMYSVDFANSVVQRRKNVSSAPVSRAFLHDSEYHYISYYESGSGSVNTVAPIAVTPTAGDFLSGGITQTVTVGANDSVQGANFTLAGTSVGVTSSLASTTITATDKVEAYAVVAGDALNGNGILMPVGTNVLKWTFANAPGAGYPYSTLSVGGCSSASANGTWEILPSAGAATHTLYTRLYNTAGTTAAPATFTATGSVAIFANAIYTLPGLDAAITDPATISLYNTILVSGCVNSGNNGTKGIVYFTLDPAADPNSGYWRSPTQPTSVIVSLGSQVNEIHANTITVQLLSPGRWDFERTTFDDSYIGTNLVVEQSSTLDTTPTADLGSFVVTSTAPHFLQTNGADAAGLVSHIWRSAPYPTVTVTQDLQKANRIKLQSVTFDYALIGALISIQGSAISANNGVYRVDTIDTTDAGNHTVFVTPQNGLGNQRNQLLSTETITIFPATTVNQVFQPTWFMTPASGTQPQVGRFDDRLAYAGWIQEGQIVSGQPFPNLYPRALSSVTTDSTGKHVVLPYRASGFIAGQLLVAPNGQVTNAASTTIEATIGLKTFTLSTETGDAFPAFNELLIPGPLATSFTKSGFHEQGVNLGMEKPFIVSEEHDTSPTVIGLTPNAKYEYQLIAQSTDENGDVAISIPSPVLEVTLTGANNTVTIGGRLLNPLTTAGLPATGVFGMSNRKLTVSIYRTAIVNGTPTTNLYRITDPLNSNGPIYSGSGAGSGFTFMSDGITFKFRDQVADAVIVNEDTIPSQSTLPAFPAPAFRQGCVWLNRAWLVGADGAVYPSNEKQEGRALSFFPGFSYRFPSNAVAAAPLDSNLYVFCADKSIWTIPAATYADAANPPSGSFPTPRLTPFRNSCTGHATTIREGVVYSSTAGNGSQLWLINRNQQNVWLSQPIQDSLVSSISGLAVDSRQRLFVSTGASLWCYDGIPDLWSQVLLPGFHNNIAAIDGNVAYQDSTQVAVQDPNAHVDTILGTIYPIPLDITLAGLSFAQVRAFVRLWALQIIGEYRGPHKLNAILTYPDDMPGFPTYFLGMVPDPSKPYLLEINPTNELCSNFGLRIYSSFEGVEEPGDSFTLELVAAMVGLRQGQRDVPSGQRFKATG